MSNPDTALAFHDFITDILTDLAADEDGPDADLREAMAGVTDMILESLRFSVTSEGVAELRLPNIEE